MPLKNVASVTFRMLPAGRKGTFDGRKAVESAFALLLTKVTKHAVSGIKKYCPFGRENNMCHVWHFIRIAGDINDNEKDYQWNDRSWVFSS